MIGVTIEKAIELILEKAEPVTTTEYISVLEANGRILVEDVFAPIDNPPFDRSPIDGYGVRGEDTMGATKENPVTLKVIDEICAGEFSEKAVSKNDAVRIMTGAPFPKGVNAAIMQEQTNYGEKEVAIYKEIKPYENYCYAGEDYKKGTILVEKNAKITYIEQGILSSAGFEQVRVWKKSQIALITTGDEMVVAGSPLTPGKIYNSNHMMLSARLQELGFSIAYAVHVVDDPNQVAKKIIEASQVADLIITTGGVSVGKKDVLHGTLEALEIEKVFWRIQIKPGTPALFSVYNERPIISLSGNPFAAIANMELLVRPALAKINRDPSLKTKTEKGRMADEFKKVSKRRRFIRGHFEKGEVTLGEQKNSSGVIASMRGCNCMIDIPEGNKGLKIGDEVCVVLL
ncbi:MAG: molybdopterin molybdotransferase MoeA [Eubacteriaceae bacterium]